MTEQTWFITGASRGFGAAIAAHALEQGANVVATARDPQAAAAALGPSERLLTLELDVTDAGQARVVAQQAVERFGSIDVLINNAGRGLIGAMEEITDAEARSLFDLNVFGVLNVSRPIVALMRAQGSGRIVNIGSQSGLSGDPGASMYNASKFALEGLSEAMKLELAAFGIDVLIVEPGSFRTDFLDSSSIQLPEQPIAAYDDTPAGLTRAYVATAERDQAGDPAKLAALIFEVVSEPAMPTHLPMGEDAVVRLETKLADTAAELALWRDRALATAFDEGR